MVDWHRDMLLLLLLLSRFSHVWFLATPWTAAYQAPQSLGFSKQEHWSGLPFPSPMYESEKWKVKVKSLSCVRLLATPWTAAYQAPPSMDFPGKSTEVGCHCLLREICYESLKGNYLLRHNSAVTMLDVNISNPPEERIGQLVMSMCYVSNRRFWTVKLWCKGPIAKTSSVLKTDELDVLESAVQVKVTHLCLTLCDPNGL